MIKNCILILVVGLIMLGCGNRQVRQIEQVREDSTEITIKTPYDTVHFKFKWRETDLMCTPKFGLINNSDSMSSVLYRAHVV